MDLELEKSIKIQNKQYLDDYIQKKEPAFEQFEYDHARKLKVCKHFLMDRCYRDDKCDYAHQIVPSKMPDCKFYEDCTDYFCQYKHRDDQEIQLGCPDFNRGVEFAECKCKFRGKLQQMCPRYAAGFCPDGPNCPMAHPRWDKAIERAEINSQIIAPCIKCGEYHLAIEMNKPNWDKDKWVDNSCSVIFKCRDDPKPSKISHTNFKPAIFNTQNASIDIWKIAEEVIREIEADVRKQEKLKSTRQ